MDNVLSYDGRLGIRAEELCKLVPAFMKEKKNSGMSRIFKYVGRVVRAELACFKKKTRVLNFWLGV